jgi:hypothetical protein
MDAYAVCRYVLQYHEKNCYAPDRSKLGCYDTFVEMLIKNDIIKELPLHEGGPPVLVVLTEKGMRMAKEKRR